MKWIIWLFWQAISLILLVALPFILLIRGAIWIYSAWSMPSWLALGLSGLLTAFVIFLYLNYFIGRLSGRWAGSSALKRRGIASLILVAGFVIQAFFFLSNSHFKEASIEKEYSQLHPFLKLGINALSYLDADLIITDANRQPEDYRKMGLKSKKHSLHYPQSNGFVHAVDLRTRGHSSIRNWIIKSLLRCMGFNVLRHTGTADHLHVSLKSKDRPSAI